MKVRNWQDLARIVGIRVGSSKLHCSCNLATVDDETLGIKCFLALSTLRG